MRRFIRNNAQDRKVNCSEIPTICSCRRKEADRKHPDRAPSPGIGGGGLEISELANLPVDVSMPGLRICETDTLEAEAICVGVKIILFTKTAVAPMSTIQRRQTS